MKRSLTLVFGSRVLSEPSGVGGGEVAPLTGEEVPFWGVLSGDRAGASWDLREEGLELAAEAGLESTGAVCIFVEERLAEELMRKESEKRVTKVEEEMRARRKSWRCLMFVWRRRRMRPGMMI